MTVTNKDSNLYRVIVTGYMAGDEEKEVYKEVIFNAKTLSELDGKILSHFPKSYVYSIEMIDVLREDFSLSCDQE